MAKRFPVANYTERDPIWTFKVSFNEMIVEKFSEIVEYWSILGLNDMM